MGTVYSNLLTDLNTVPRERLHSGVQRGRVRSIAGTIEVATGDIDAADIIMLARVKSSDRVRRITLFNDDLDSNGSPTLAAHVGLYQTDGTLVDADAYASAITTLQAANAVGVNVAFEARDVAKMGQPVWKDAGLTEDNGAEYLIAITISNAAATAAGGTISFDVELVED